MVKFNRPPARANFATTSRKPPLQEAPPPGSPPSKEVVLPGGDSADRRLALLLAAVTLGLLLRDVVTDLLPGDAGEFHFAAWNWGLAHPTGYPLYLLLGGGWQRLWARALYRGGEACFDVHTEVEKVDFPDDAPGPFLVFARHTSVADTMLPLVVIRHEMDIVLRYVIKRELLVEPAIDVAGQRIPNAFVRRSGADLSKEVEQVRKIVRDVTPGQGVLIYPEGTRFSPKKHAERLARHQDRGAE